MILLYKKNAIDFKGIYRDVSPNDNVDFGIMAHFHPYIHC